MRDLALIAAAGLLAYAAWRLRQVESDAADGAGWLDEIEAGSEAVLDAGADVVTSVQNALGVWRAPARYAGTIRTAEAMNGIPPTMIERLLWQESRYRDDIITGRTVSPAGAQGIAQFMPDTAAELGVNPLDPVSAINGAARYLARLRASLGSWSEALAAYNWGIGNVQRKGLSAAPRETRRYYTEILADVNATAGTALA